MVGDFEGGGQGEIGWVKKGFLAGVAVVVGGLMGSTCRDEDIERRGRVVMDIDGEVQGVSDPALRDKESYLTSRWVWISEPWIGRTTQVVRDPGEYCL